MKKYTVHNCKALLRSCKAVLIDHTINGDVNLYIFRLLKLNVIKEITFANNYGIYKLIF